MNKQKGFTFIEILVTVAVVGLIILVSSSLNKDVIVFSRIFQSGLNAADEARKILRPMANEIRSASPSSAGAYPIESATATSFIFFSDIDSDGDKDRVRYYLSGTTLKKGVINPSGNPAVYSSMSEVNTDIVHNIQNGATPIFLYYDAYYDGTTNPLPDPVSISSIRLIKINFIIDSDLNKLPSATTISTQVSFRNLKDNL
ncbi:MAG: prepilin-type N-terminal cleavage/methylation domain-containing protein [Candidatus Pacebacteria bacterium]|nr:prepilin-type N-terminal cleavage/methylation domain-containing protein [Candidatus Paceibacterota bacterium]MBP9772603.1 prepilin-type N-terminal cleavage/methylation domain-containing protein [Candidatus Paceibacterota bacterium]QQR76965.1 MAG: prepilin-type N-terminal cleavage/methylation domain-containing protein [Candidatus Nomurabacteria bacterium]